MVAAVPSYKDLETFAWNVPRGFYSNFLNFRMSRNSVGVQDCSRSKYPKGSFFNKVWLRMLVAPSDRMGLLTDSCDFNKPTGHSSSRFLNRGKRK